MKPIPLVEVLIMVFISVALGFLLGGTLMSRDSRLEMENQAVERGVARYEVERCGTYKEITPLYRKVFKWNNEPINPPKKEGCQCTH